MIRRGSIPSLRSARSVAWLAILCVSVICLLAMIGWLFDIALFKSIEPRWIEMRIITVLCMALCTGALALIHQTAVDRRRRTAATVMGAVVGLVALLTVGVYLFDLAGGRESFLARAPFTDLFLAPTDRMALWTASIFLVSGCVIMLLAAGGRRAANLAHALVIPAAIASYLVPISYVLGVERIHGLLNVPVALNTGFAFCALCIAIFCLRPDTWLMRVFTGDHAGGVMARRLFPVLLIIPPLIGWLRLYGERQGIFASEVGVVLVAMTYTVCLLFFLWLSARSVNRTDRLRRSAVDALRASERRFATTLASIGDAVIATDADARVTFLNPVAAELTGWRPEEAAGRSIGEVFLIVDERTRAPAEDIVQRVLREGRVVSLANHAALTCRDGRVVPIEDSAAPIRDDAGKLVGVVLVFRDVTQKRQALEALRQSEARLRSLYASMSEGLAVHELVYDGARRAMDYRILEVNPAYEKITGIPRDRAVGGLASRLYGTEAPPYLDVYSDVANTGRATTFETYFPPMEKHFQISVFSPAKDLFATVFEDITERKRAEVALHRSRDELEGLVRDRTAALESEQRRFHDVLELLPVYVALLSPDYHVPFANRFFRERFGDSGGRRCFEFLFGRTEPCETCETYTVLKTKAPHRWDWTGPDGCSYQIADFPFTGTDGSTLIMEVGIDVTERNRAEAELRALNAKLEQRATQLRALTTELAQTEDRERRRLAQILHDHLQQLLVAAKFSAESLCRTASDEARREGAQRMLEVLDQAIAASRSLTIELSPPILHEAGLTAGLTWLARWMEEKHGFQVEVTAPPHADRLSEAVRLLLFQAVRELLFNAVKHSGVKRASVAVELEGPDEVRVNVSDVGVGFDAAAQEIASPPGSFGLLNIRERLAYFDGRVTIDSAPGRGTRATLTVPIGAAGTLEPASPTTMPRAVPGSGVPCGDVQRIRVLIADDHAVVRQGLVQTLGLEPDLEVVGEAVDGFDAVEKARALDPDVVLIDMSMPRMDGLEATRRITAAMPRVRVIGLSMHAQEQVAQQMAEAGAASYLVKDSPVEVIAAAIREACRKA